MEETSRPEALAIGDYAFVGDRHSGALIGRNGSIDWLCLPRFDSPACFTALLGTPEHGRWLLGPAEAATTTRRYVDGTLVLETTHVTAEGRVRVTDLMPTGDQRADVVRRVEGLEGTVRMRQDLRVRFGYGEIVPWVHRIPDESEHGCDEALVAVGGADLLVLRGPRLPRPEHQRHVDEFDVTTGDVLDFDLTWAPSYRPVPEPLDIDASLERTVRESQQWLGAGGVSGPYAEAVAVSLLVLRALSHELTGGIVAAPTASLPEEMGGERNWDYRYTWLRDAALTVEAVLVAGYGEKAVMWRDWLLRAIAGDVTQLQIMYAVDGHRELPERTLEHLPGYGGSRPVRVGNGAVDQRQVDVLGEVMIALEMLRDKGIDESEDSWQLQRALVDGLCEHWREPDHGLWEMRGPLRHFTHSRVMVWAAFDRAIRAVEEHGHEGEVDRWRAVREEVRAEVDERGYNAEIGSFTQHYDTTEVDASLLLLPVVGFVAADDPRFVGTVERIEHDLLRDGLVLRYRTSSGYDGLSGDEHPFLLCCFWLVTAYALMGRQDDGEALMERLLNLRNDVGLMAEEYDSDLGALMGNFPQAFSHLGLIQAALALERARDSGRSR